jgi:hypothetical protein
VERTTMPIWFLGLYLAAIFGLAIWAAYLIGVI